jgi:hypothetical protein
VDQFKHLWREMLKIHEIIECQYSRWYVAKLEANAWQVEQDEGHLYEVEMKDTCMKLRRRKLR